MIEQYGTGIPCIKRYCDVEGVKFSYRQTANTTVIRFDRPGALHEGVPSRCRKPREAANARKAIRPGRGSRYGNRPQNGRVTKRELMAEAGIGKTKATETLKTLASKGMLEWVGASTNDPRQYYRPHRNQLNRYCPPVFEPAGSSNTPSISPTAQKVVNLAAEADIEDVMSSMMLERMRFCTLETVPVAQLAAAAISRCV